MAWKLIWEVEIDTVALALAGGKALVGLILKKVVERMITKICMIKSCHRLAASQTSRGLCLVCYSQAKKKVELGETTWTDLAKLGLCLDKEENCPFNDAYSKATREGE